MKVGADHQVLAGARGKPRKRRRARSIRNGPSVWSRIVHALRRLPMVVRLCVFAAIIVLGGAGFNWLYHTLHKPSELLFALDNALDKRPYATWQEYGALFQTHSTPVMAPELLAALAQVESAGNPIARTYWRWRPSWNLLDIYRPASSAVGMFQITDATFEEGKRYCIHDHRVVQDGAWNDIHSCWFNSLYSRVFPSHAIELTAAWLDRAVASAVGAARGSTPTLHQQRTLAAVIHLCGAGAGRAYAARGYRPTPHQRCGDHDVHAYLHRVGELTRTFARLAAGENLLRFRTPR